MAACKVKVCRICFAVDCELHRLHENMELYKAYEAVTGLMLADEEDLPPYLCSSCADQLMNCARFRHRSLQAHLMLLDILKKHDHISLDSIQVLIKTAHCSNIGHSNKEIASNFQIDIKPEDINVTVGELSDEIKIELIADDVGADDLTSVESKRAVISRDHGYCDSGIEHAEEGTIFSDLQIDLKRDDILVDAANLRDEIETECMPDVAADDVVGDEATAPCVATDDVVKEEVFDETFNDVDDSQLGTGEDVSLNGLPSGQEGKLKTVGGERTEETGGLNQMEGTEVHEKRVEKVTLVRDLLGFLNDSGTQIFSQLRADNIVFNGNATDRITESITKVLPTAQRGQQHSCHLCGKIFSTNKGLGNHLHGHSAKEHVCDVCKKSFRREATLKHHVLECGKAYSCGICKKSYSNKSYLKDHIKLHSVGKQFKCDLCKKTFQYKWYYQKHLQKHKGDLPFTCDVCRKSFSFKCNLENHMLGHLGVKSFSCETCKRSYVFKGNLRRHMEVHSSEKASCDICNKSFSRKGSLSSHMRIHSGQKPYVCDACGASFGERTNLRRHLLVNAGDEFSCDVCRKTFSAKCHYKCHMSIDFGDEPYACGICKQSFGRKYHLRNHMRKHSSTP